jgi:hypothetical protein
MFQWIFDRLWTSTQAAPGSPLEALKFTVHQGRRYKAVVTLSGFEQMVATNDAIKSKLTDCGFKDVTVKGDGAKRTAEGIWAKADTSAELDPHLSNIVELQSAADAKPAPAPAPTPAPAPVASAAATTVAATSSPEPGSHFESVVVDGKPVAADFFLFASNTLTEKAIKAAKEKYNRVLVGFDAGAIPQTGPIYLPAFKLARDLGAELEIYVEGPGGETGTTGWAADEMARVKCAAERVGIDTRAKDWLVKGWDKGGWKAYTFLQLEAYAKQGFHGAEIDNLARVITDADALIAFYKEYAARHKAGTFPQLVMKNISEEGMTRVVKALETGELPRAMFSEFHIYECGQTEEWAPVDKISRAQGIRTVASRNTNRYDAKGTFGLQDQFDKAYGLNGGGSNGDGSNSDGSNSDRRTADTAVV